MTANLSGIYEIKNKASNKIYIGSAVNLRKRKNLHFHKLRKNIHTNPHLQNSFNKYGENSFEFFPIIYCDKKMLLFYEQLIINKYNPAYNINPNAQSRLGTTHSEKSKIKMSIARMGKSPINKGIPMSDELKRKDSESHIGKISPMLGKHHNKESKRKISEAKKGYAPWNKGVPMSYEAKIKDSKSHAGKHDSKETKNRKSISAKKAWKLRKEGV